MASKKQKSSEPAVDFEAMADAQPTSLTDLREISKLAEEMLSNDSKIAELEMQIQTLADRNGEIELNILPDLMAAAGMKKFSLSNGDNVEIKDIVRASIPSQTAIEKAEGIEQSEMVKRRAACLAWLRKNGAESMIKNQLVAEFGKGQDVVAKKLLSNILARGYKARVEESVNFQSLNAYFRELIEAGRSERIPTETFSLFIGKKAELKAAKKKGA